MAREHTTSGMAQECTTRHWLTLLGDSQTCCGVASALAWVACTSWFCCDCGLSCVASLHGALLRSCFCPTSRASGCPVARVVDRVLTSYMAFRLVSQSLSHRRRTSGHILSSLFLGLLLLVKNSRRTERAGGEPFHLVRPRSRPVRVRRFRFSGEDRGYPET